MLGSLGDAMGNGKNWWGWEVFIHIGQKNKWWFVLEQLFLGQFGTMLYLTFAPLSSPKLATTHAFHPCTFMALHLSRSEFFVSSLWVVSDLVTYFDNRMWWSWHCRILKPNLKTTSSFSVFPFGNCPPKKANCPKAAIIWGSPSKPGGNDTETVRDASLTTSC